MSGRVVPFPAARRARKPEHVKALIDVERYSARAAAPSDGSVMGNTTRDFARAMLERAMEAVAVFEGTALAHAGRVYSEMEGRA